MMIMFTNFKQNIYFPDLMICIKNFSVDKFHHYYFSCLSINVSMPLVGRFVNKKAGRISGSILF